MRKGNSWLCDDLFYKEEGLCDKVRDLCHTTEKHREAAHTHCKLNTKQRFSSMVPNALHNITKYDSHLFINELINLLIKKYPVPYEVIAESDERLTSITYGPLINIDSLNFVIRVIIPMLKKWVKMRSP